MKEKPTTFNQLWAQLAIEELVRQGVTAFFMAPGSRCTPLTLAVAQHPKAEAILHFDERGCAFQALGWARAAGRPAVIVTTSGTAVANLVPAVTEAAQEGVPLLLMTADRPPELRDNGANQAIDQVKYFGGLVRWFADIPCPSESIPATYLLTTVGQAVRRSVASDPGPVHLNFMFREPLSPDESSEDVGDALASVGNYLEGSEPYTFYPETQVQVADPELDALVHQLCSAARGLIVVGSLRSRQEQDAVSQLVQRIDWPVITDVASGLRSADGLPTLVPYAEAVVRTASFAAAHRPDFVLYVGGRLVSKHIERFVASAHRLVRIAGLPCRLDVAHIVGMRIEADLISTCLRLSEKLPDSASPTWTKDWVGAGARAASAVDAFERDALALSEPLVARLLWHGLPQRYAVFLGNSMPIRDMDFMAYGGEGLVAVGVNRGASGIDGLVATACGQALAWQRPTTLLLGDLSLLHDLNSLSLVRQSPVPMRVVVLNNHGGGIFHFLPVSRQADLFETYFGTPHPYRFEAAAAMFGLAYANPQTPKEFEESCEEAAANGRSTLIEVVTDRTDNLAMHRSLLEQVTRAVDSEELSNSHYGPCRLKAGLQAEKNPAKTRS